MSVVTGADTVSPVGSTFLVALYAIALPSASASAYSAPTALGTYVVSNLCFGELPRRLIGPKTPGLLPRVGRRRTQGGRGESPRSRNVLPTQTLSASPRTLDVWVLPISLPSRNDNFLVYSVCRPGRPV